MPPDPLVPEPGAAEARLAGAVEDLETLLRKAGVTGERAYRTLCDLLVVTAHLERQGVADARDLAGGGSLREGIEAALASAPAPPEDGFGAVGALDERHLEAALDALGDVAVTDLDVDAFGLFYGRLFSDAFRGESGTFFTPRQVVAAMVELAAPRPGETVCDPACGSGGFLAWTARRCDGCRLVGNDVDPVLADAARANLAVAGAPDAEVTCADLFGDAYVPARAGEMDLVLANPPFSVEYDREEVWDGFELEGSTVGSGYLFVEAARRLLRPGGRLVSLFPLSLIANDEHEPFRRRLRDGFAELACVTLPEGVFYPHAGTTTQACVLALVREEGPYDRYPALKANVAAVGYDTSRKRYTPVEANDFPRLFASDAYERFAAIRDDVVASDADPAGAAGTTDAGAARAADAAAPGDATDPTDPADPDRATDPTAPADSTDPTDPADPGGAADPTDRIHDGGTGG